MQEYESNIITALKKGLRQNAEEEANHPTLIRAMNLRPYPSGLISIPTPTAQLNPTGSQQTAYFPSLLPGSFDVKGVVKNAAGRMVFGTVGEDGLFSTTDFSGYASSITDGTLSAVPLTTEPVEFVETEDMWIVTDGSIMVTNSEAFADRQVFTSYVVSDSDTAIPKSISLWGTRLVMAGFTDGAAFSSLIWSRMTEERLRFLTDAQITRGGHTLDPAKLLFIFGPKGDDFDLPFSPALIFCYNFGLDTFEEVLADMVRSQMLTIIDVRARGDILHVRGLANRLFVYTTEEIIQITASENGFAQSRLRMHGLPHAGAFWGDENRHLWVDSDGVLWSTLNEYIPQRLGYEEYFSPLIDAGYRCSIHHDPLEDDFYITFSGASSQAFVLTQTGMGQTRYCYSGFIRFGNSILGAYEDTEDTDIEVVTNVLDFNRRAIKFFPQVLVSQRLCTDITVAMDYKFSHEDAYVRTTALAVNTKSIAYPKVSGTDVRLVITATPAEGCFIDRLHVKWKSTDNHDARGLTTQPEQTI